jgi:hypothetical protein
MRPCTGGVVFCIDFRIGDDDDDDDYGDNKPDIFANWSVGALFRGARRSRIDCVCFDITPLQD